MLGFAGEVLVTPLSSPSDSPVVSLLAEWLATLGEAVVWSLVTALSVS